MHEKISLLSAAQALVANFFVISFTVLLYFLIIDAKIKDSREKSWILGIGFGCASLLSMLFPVPVREGVVLDAKYVLTALSVVFGGWHAGIITAFLSGVGRIWLGGIGIFAAVPALCLTVLLSWWLNRKNPEIPGMTRRVLFWIILGFAVWFAQWSGGLAFWFFIPREEVRELMWMRSAPAFLVFPLATISIGLTLDLIRTRRVLQRQKEISETYYQDLFRQAPVGLLIMNAASGEVEAQNAMSARLWNGVLEEEKRIFFERVKKEIAEKDFWQAETEMNCSQGETRVFSVRCVRFGFSEHRLYLVSLIDTTAERFQAIQIQSLLSTLERQNRDLQWMNRSLHHELRTPLLSIQAYLAEMEERIATRSGENELRDLMQGVCLQVRTLTRLISGVSEYSREAGKHPVHEPKTAVRATLLQAIRVMEREISNHCAIDYADEEIFVFLNERDLRFILFSLLSNALKATRSVSDPRIQILWGHENSMVWIDVRDNGIGIEAQYHQKIFGLFEKLDRQTSGLGVGLSLSLRIAERAGGNLSVRWSEPGQGSCFRLVLPGN